MTGAYPLAWPAYWPRRPAADRSTSRFSTLRYQTGSKGKLTTNEALQRLFSQIDRLRADNLVVSTNVAVRRDGFPFSNASTPDDPAVAVYFGLAGKPHCMPCDRWDRVADNIAAVGKHIEAMRGMERWGVGTIEAAFSGFKALPPPQTEHWSEVLKVDRYSIPPVIDRAYRNLAKQAGDDQAELLRLNLAVEKARGKNS